MSSRQARIALRDQRQARALRDRHVRRSGLDYAQQFMHLLPTGQAWPRGSDCGSPDTVLERVCRGLSDYWGFVDGRAADLLVRESDPRTTIELLPDWERAWGLPDPCFISGQSISERQRILVLWMTWLGAQSRDYLTAVAKLVGYDIQIEEYAPFQVGISRCGDTKEADKEAGGDGTKPRWEIGPPEMRFYWSTNATAPSLTWFRAGASEVGADPHLRIGIDEEIHCLLNRWKPAHTQIVFRTDYSQLDEMSGTP